MKKYISVSKEGIRKLMATFKVGDRCVRNALAYRSNNELARKIQFTAVKHYGGCVYSVDKEAECFFDSDSCMRYVCPNGAEIYLDKQTGEGKIYDPQGTVVVSYPHVPLTKINEMQQYAAAL